MKKQLKSLTLCCPVYCLCALIVLIPCANYSMALDEFKAEKIGEIDDYREELATLRQNLKQTSNTLKGYLPDLSSKNEQSTSDLNDVIKYQQKMNDIITKCRNLGFDSNEKALEKQSSQDVLDDIKSSLTKVMRQGPIGSAAGDLKNSILSVGGLMMVKVLRPLVSLLSDLQKFLEIINDLLNTSIVDLTNLSTSMDAQLPLIDQTDKDLSKSREIIVTTAKASYAIEKEAQDIQQSLQGQQIGQSVKGALYKL